MGSGGWCEGRLAVTSSSASFLPPLKLAISWLDKVHQPQRKWSSLVFSCKPAHPDQPVPRTDHW